MDLLNDMPLLGKREATWKSFTDILRLIGQKAALSSDHGLYIIEEVSYDGTDGIVGEWRENVSQGTTRVPIECQTKSVENRALRSFGKSTARIVLQIFGSQSSRL